MREEPSPNYYFVEEIARKASLNDDFLISELLSEDYDSRTRVRFGDRCCFDFCFCGTFLEVFLVDVKNFPPNKKIFEADTANPRYDFTDLITTLVDHGACLKVNGWVSYNKWEKDIRGAIEEKIKNMGPLELEKVLNYSRRGLI